MNAPGAAALMLLAIAPLLTACSPPEGSDEPAPTAAVVTAVAAEGSLSAAAVGYGTVVSAPGHSLIIAMPHDGAIASVDVRDGSIVRAGQPIVTIAIAPAAAAQFAQARAALEFAKSELARLERLFADKLATNDQLAAARKALSDAQAMIDQQTNTGADKAQDTLRAPFDGVITGLAATPGDRPSVGAPIATLSSRSNVVIELGLESADAAKLTQGAAARLTLPQETAELSGKLSVVGAAVDPVSRLVKATVQIAPNDATRVTLGTTLVAHVDLPALDGVIVPRGALLEDAEGAYLFAVVDGKARRRAVEITAETNDAALIEGVEAGTTVVVSGNAALEDGVAVAQAKP